MYIFIILALFLMAWGSDFWQGPQRVVGESDLQQAQTEAVANNFDVFSQAANTYVTQNLEALSSCKQIYTSCEIQEIPSASLTNHLPHGYRPLATWRMALQGNVLFVYALPNDLPTSMDTSMIASALYRQDEAQVGIGVIESGSLKSPGATTGYVHFRQPNGTLVMVRQYGT